MLMNHNHVIAFRQFWRRSPGGAFCYPTRATLLTVALAFSLAAALTVALMAGGWDASYAGEPGQVAASNPKQYRLAGDAWPILDLSAPLPRYAFAQVQDSTPPTFVSSGLDITTRVLSITFSETIDATSVDPTKIHIRESGNYTGGITLTAGELGTAADGNAISFILTPSHSAAVAVLAAPELTIDPGAVRDASGNAIASTLDTSTASHVYSSSVLRHNVESTDVEFSNDGLRMFTLDHGGQSVNEYILIKAFDLSAGSGFIDSFSVYPRMPAPFKMAFSNDGTKMFVIGITQDREQESISTGVPIAPTGQSKTWAIDEYTLSTAFDVSTAQYVDSLQVSEPGSFSLLLGLTFSNDGTKMFVVGDRSGSVYTYTLSTAFDVSTASHVDATPFPLFGFDMRDIVFSNDGTQMFIIDNYRDRVFKYTLSTAFDVSTARRTGNFPTLSYEISPRGLALSDDDSKIFVIGARQRNVDEYTLSSVYPMTVISSVAPVGDHFVTTWRTGAVNETVTIPVYSGLTYYYTVIWGDGSTDTGVADDASHTYAVAGDHQVRIYGTFPGIHLDGHRDADKLVLIDQWGSNRWASMESAFKGASLMAYAATDAPDLSGVTDMSNMFANANRFNGDISSWNVSQVTDMSYMFSAASDFDQPLNGWDVSAVTTMSNMFSSAAVFDRPLNGWNVSSITDMSNMFYSAFAFNQSLNNWNVSDVTDMTDMFHTRLYQNLGSWYVVANATSIARNYVPGVVAEFSAQNAQLDGHSPTYGKGTSGDWEYFGITGSEGNLLSMTSAAAKDTYYVNVTASGSSIFGNSNSWHTVKITVMDDTISPIPILTTDAVMPTDDDSVPVSVDFGEAINAATFAASDVSVTGGTASELTHLSGNRTFAFTLTPDTAGQVTVSIPAGSITDLAGNANAISNTLQITIAPGLEWFVTTWKTTADSNVITLPLNGTGIIIDWGDGDIATGISETATHRYADAGNHTVSISGGLEHIILNNTASASKLISIDQWGSTQWTSMKNAFYGTANMVYKATDAPDLSDVHDMSGMFRESSFNGNPSSWNVSQVTDMNRMFHSTSKFNQPLNDWNVSQVIYINGMFFGASKFNQPLNDWNVSQVTDMSYMFLSASKFNQPLNDWNVSQVTSMYRMFSEAPDFNQPLNDWNVSQVTSMYRMFNGASSFHQNLGNWYVVANATSIARSDVPGVVAELSMQNTVLNGHSTTYGIGKGGDSDLFKIANDNELNMTSVEAKSSYRVNVTTSESSVFENGGNWRVLGITVTESANTAPTVNAGTDQEITEGDTVTLAGTATDADPEDDLTYSWSHDSTLFISLDDSTLTPSFTVPNVSEDTAVEFTLTVSDGTTDVSDQIIITITDSANTAPTVNAGTDQEITEGDTVTLAGTATDADPEDDLTYSWSHDSTLFISLDDSTLTPSFTVPNVSEDTAVEFTLTVSDGTTDVSDQIIITITDSANTAPTVNAGTDQEITEGDTVTLAGTATDADPEDDLTYSWSHDSTLFISLDDSTLTPSFTVPNVSEDTAVEFTLTVSDGTTDVSDQIIITITDSANTAPTVNAGTDQEITEGDTVTLAGTATDADPEDDLTYSWSHDSTLFISLDDSTLTPSFTVPNVSEDTAVEFTLTVSDGTTDVSDQIIITITDSANTAPTVNAGTDQEITEGDTVTLAGTATDADPEDDLTYSWSHDSTLFISLDDSTLTPSFTVPNVSEDTAVEFTLTVSDGTTDVSDQIIITITDSANTAPTVNAGTDQEITEGDTVTLAGTATDADPEDDLTYSWSHDSTLFISLDDSTLTPSFTVPNVSEDTAVEFTLTVSDGTTDVSDQIIITITDSANTAPTVNAGTDQEITEGDTVTLAGTATDADPEDDLTYSWSHDSTLFISLDDSTLTPSFTVPNVSEDTAVEFTLTVSDGTTDVSDQIIITITDSANTAPTVNAGTDQEITEGDTVTLAGTATDADPEDDLTYSWSHDSTLFISLDDSTLTPSFTVPNVSEDTAVEFTLTVSDGTTDVSDQIIITITDSANTAPTVNAGTDQEITEGDTVTLAGTATDADPEDDLTYSWSHDSTLFISLDDSTLTPSFTVPNVSEDTAVEFTLTVSDGIITVSDSIIITITDSANTAPTVNAGTDQEITEGDTVTLAGTATDADPEDDLTYSWSHDSTLFISLDDSTLTPSFTVPNVSEDTAVEFTLTVSDGIITVSDSIIITITDSANTAPTVNAGTDQEITEGDTVTLAGTATDADPEDDLTYSWSHDSTLFISLDDSTLTPSFTVPNVSEDTAVEFTLTVSDGIITVSDSIIITITDSANTAPTVNAGTDQEITEGDTVTLAGTATDADPEDDLTYSWSHDSTLFISLDDSTLTPSFTVPNVSEDTAVEFTLTVSDGIITVSDSIIITITDSANTAPTVNAGTDQEITEGDTVTLAGTATDADPEDDLTYSWSHDSTLFISLDDSTLTPSFTVPNVSEDTAVEFTLTVSDGIITVSDSIIITITDSANTAPTVNAGTDQEITEGDTVTLAGTATDADPEDDLTYSWSHDSTLFISLDDSTLTPSFTVPNVSEDTAVEFTLTVSDGIITVSDSIIITITDSANTAPTVNAGTDQEITEGDTVTLAGTATDADPEDDLTYSWSHDSTLFISLDDSTLTPSFTVPNVSEDTAVEFTLTVSDGIITVSDSIIITITDSANTAPTVNAGTDQEITEGVPP